MADERTFADYVAVIKRRWRVSAAVGALVFFGFVVAAYIQTAVYQASATIQIEKPLIPDQMVKTTVASYAEELLASVTQRVMTAANIHGLIEKFKLYPDQRSSMAMDELVAQFRADTSVTPSVVDAPTRYGRPAAITYAFTVSFKYSDPQTASDVANELAKLHVTQNSELRAGSAARTSQFLEQEAGKVAKRLSDVQSQINRLQGSSGAMIASQDPAMAATRYDQIDRDLANVDQSLREARERRDLLESDLLQTSKYRAVLSDGQPVVRGEDRLVAAQQELVAAQAKYSDDHPDILRLKREIAALTGGSVDYGSMITQLQANVSSTQEQLATARQAYSEDHPDVIRLKRILESQQKQLADAQTKAATPTARPAAADNPVYLQLQTRMRTADQEIAELSGRRAQLYARLSQYSYNPDLEAKYAPLARERDLLQAQYTDLREKYTAASLAESVESEDKGQILTMVEAARAPASPIEPNRIMLVFLGFVIGLAAAFSTASLTDSMDTSVRGSRDVEMLLRMSPIAMIPFIDTPEDVIGRRKKRMIISFVMLAIGIFVVMLVK
jgi:uncharacterized protein involved in exopolysaccharide biosynthesis